MQVTHLAQAPALTEPSQGPCQAETAAGGFRWGVLPSGRKTGTSGRQQSKMEQMGRR